jgi:hypothetical protein
MADETGKQKKSRVPELDIEMRGTADIARYVKAGRGLQRDLAFEYDQTAAELQAILRASANGFDRMTAGIKARRVTRRLRRAAVLSQAAGVELVKFWAMYRNEYEELVKPKRSRNRWQWEER